MDRKRKVYAPFSQTSEAGVTQTPVEGYIDVNQTIYPTVNTGVVNEKGQWSGVKSNDTDFKIFGKDEQVPDGSIILVPTGNADPDNFIDMTGFEDILIALRVSNGGNYKIDAVMGSDVYSFANLSPINAAKRIEIAGRFDVPASLQTAFYDSSQALTADVWDVFNLQGMLSNQKLLQFKVTNNSGGASDIEFAYMRLV